MNRKTFDCVQMKWDIQRKQREELIGMSEAEKRRTLAERIQADPVLGPFLQRVRRAASPSARRESVASKEGF